uniref:Minor tail protein n=1 Tax=Siphoviridae sp. ctlgF9 TaxID=2825649 RepID=A0A8S5PVP0_9CAUD|nr:MAG TPA: minor tail protein [Siphoviridae sp. ctlgF9]
MANTIQIIIKARDQATQEMDRVSAASGKLKKHLEPVGSAMKLVGAGALAAGVASVKMAGDYEQGLNIFKSVSGATAQQMAMVAAKARELGQDASLPGVSARDAANAMTELSKAGLSVNDTLAASKGVMSLAKAGQIDVADAATIAAQALNAFKLKGSDAGKVADVLANGANASATDIRGLSLGLQQSAAVASQFGVSLEDTVTTLGLFANRGMQGSDAGTSLKTMLISLANPSKKASELMHQLGINAYDASGKFVGMRQLAQNLQNGLKGLSEEQKQQALATIFGTDAFRAAAFLADSAGKSYDDMSKAVGRSGAAMDLAKAQNSGFNGALDNLKSTLETVGTDIGMKLLPPLTKIIKELANSGIIETFGAALTALTPIISYVASLFIALKINQVIGWFGGLFVKVKEAGGAFQYLAGIISKNPIGLIVTAIAIVIPLLIDLEQRFHIFSNAVEWIKTAWNGMVEWFTGIFNGIGQALSNVWQAITTAFNNVTAFLQNWGPTILAIMFWPFSLLIGLVITFKDQIMAVLNALWGGISAGFQAVTNFIQTVFQVASSVVMAVWSPIAGFFGGVWNQIRGIFSGVGNFFGAVFGWAANAASGALNSIIGVASGVYNAIASFFRPIGTVAGNMIGGTIRGVVNGIIGMVQNGLNSFISMINGAAGIINKIPGVHIPGIPHVGLPRLAFGAKNYAGGVTLVGERGPELVNLPKGADVYTATQTANAFRNSRGGGGGVTIQHMEVHNDVDAHNVIEQIGWRLARG